MLAIAALLWPLLTVSPQAASASGCAAPVDACAFFDHYLDALNRRDWRAFTATFDDSISVMFDRPGPPERRDGRAAVEELFRRIFPPDGIPPARLPPPLHPEQLLAQDLGDTVVVSFHVRSSDELARRTVVLHRTANGWRVVHIHASSFDVPAVRRQSDVTYGHKAGMALTMEVFTPATRNGIGVLWVVSSSGRSSREQTLQESFDKRIAPLLDHGYTVFAVIHGSAPMFNIQDQVSDVRRAVRFVRHGARQFGVDPQRLGIAGSSAGGMLALIVAMNPDAGDAASKDPVEHESDRIHAAGAFFPPTDFTSYGPKGENIVEYMEARGGVDPTFRFYDADPKTGNRTAITERADVLRMLREYSVVSHVTAGAPPTILIHGDSDKAVPVDQSRRLIDRLEAANVPSRLVVRERVGHAYPGWEADSGLIAEWFDRYLRQQQAPLPAPLGGATMAPVP
jgi:acetyl esterase/lipase